jgi:membrane fusion protein (multidrug efflux system)
MMGFGVLAVLIVGGWFYFTGGRYIGTDNAYIKASKILLTPEVTGLITQVAVQDNQAVKKDDLILTIDPQPYQIAVEKAEANLNMAKAHIEELKAQYRQKLESLERSKIEGDYAQKEYARRYALKGKGVVPEAELAEFQRSRNTALKDIDVLQEELNQILAQLTGNAEINVEDHPDYKAADAALRQARLDLRHAGIRAPVDGIISAAPRVGDYARAGIPLANMVGTQEMWIEANFKETELTDIRLGQPVSIDIETYPDFEWKGTVQSISPATGSEFSVLPAQNATGNWVKIVQRIPVHITIEGQPDSPPLRAGMSAHVVVDTGSYPHGLGGKAR